MGWAIVSVCLKINELNGAAFSINRHHCINDGLTAPVMFGAAGVDTFIQKRECLSVMHHCSANCM